MHVFVESNYVLELAFEQSQHVFCRRILEAAEQEVIKLTVPQYALTEVFQTLGKRRLERADLQEAIAKEINQARREIDVDLEAMDVLEQSLTDLLIKRTLKQKARLFDVTTVLARLAAGPALTADIIYDAQQQERIHGLTPQDALVYASVLAGLRNMTSAEPKLFVTRNKADFNKTQLVTELRTYQCELLFDFQAAAGKLGLMNRVS